MKRSIFGGALLVVGCVFGRNAISQAAPQACPQAAAEDGNVLPPLITKRVNPRYPGIAQANLVDGDVILDAVIGTNGLVQDMTVTHGLPQLIRAATHAVSQWQYQPARINGVAIACKTTIDVHFLLQTDPAAAALNAANNFAPHTVPPNGVAAVHPMLPPPPDGVLRVSPRAMEALLENDEKPVYPADAISLDARGTVFLLMTVSKSGGVSKVQVLTGPDRFRDAAIAALRRRKYKPYEVDGEPREVQTMVSLDFAPTK